MKAELPRILKMTFLSKIMICVYHLQTAKSIFFHWGIKSKEMPL